MQQGSDICPRYFIMCQNQTWKVCKHLKAMCRHDQQSCLVLLHFPFQAWFVELTCFFHAESYALFFPNSIYQFHVDFCLFHSSHTIIVKAKSLEWDNFVLGWHIEQQLTRRETLLRQRLSKVSQLLLQSRVLENGKTIAISIIKISRPLSL